MNLFSFSLYFFLKMTDAKDHDEMHLHKRLHGSAVVDTLVDVKASSVYSGSDHVEKGLDEDQVQKTFVKSEAEKRLVRKINYTLLPFVGAIVFIQVKSDRITVFYDSQFYSLSINPPWVSPLSWASSKTRIWRDLNTAGWDLSFTSATSLFNYPTIIFFKSFASLVTWAPCSSCGASSWAAPPCVKILPNWPLPGFSWACLRPARILRYSSSSTPSTVDRSNRLPMAFFGSVTDRARWWARCVPMAFPISIMRMASVPGGGLISSGERSPFSLVSWSSSSCPIHPPLTCFAWQKKKRRLWKKEHGIMRSYVCMKSRRTMFSKLCVSLDFGWYVSLRFVTTCTPVVWWYSVPWSFKAWDLL